MAQCKARDGEREGVWGGGELEVEGEHLLLLLLHAQLAANRGALPSGPEKEEEAEDGKNRRIEQRAAEPAIVIKANTH